ncbi:hypothetical protein [Deinococcus sp. 6GRE01]|uniref:hypothetical protein n=1 Tax=Deinococcus sp. 6GRE01 TaxID=2745873 RepID=UPI001E4DEF9F|nr:hypothetical protein [Deinococcus sp. 6GRE01]MCD0156991.1 hypothetical protein [Deinococcus sp. 6GRE01]
MQITFHPTANPAQTIMLARGEYIRPQFVLVRTRSGEILWPEPTPGTYTGPPELFTSIVLAARRVNIHLRPEAHLHLRGIYWDNVRGNLEIYASLHAPNKQTPYDLEDLARRLGDGDAMHAGQLATVSIALYHVNIGGDHYTATPEDEYVKVRSLIQWQD